MTKKEELDFDKAMFDTIMTSSVVSGKKTLKLNVQDFKRNLQKNKNKKDIVQDFAENLLKEQGISGKNKKERLIKDVTVNSDGGIDINWTPKGKEILKNIKDKDD